MTREVLPFLGPEPTRLSVEAHPRETYLELPKGFGSVSPDTLIQLAKKLEGSNDPRDLSVAGAAVIEAVIFSPYRNELTEEDDLNAIQYGVQMLEEAAVGRWGELERGEIHYDDQTTAIRAEVAVAFGPIYADMISGNITNEAREQTYSKLAYWGDYIVKLGDHFGSYGLAYEIATLMGGLTDEGVILPATPRADSGRYRPKSTHDLTYLTFDADGFIKTNIPLEIKAESDDDRRLHNAARYDREHVVVLQAWQDLGLHPTYFPNIFSHRHLSNTARGSLSAIRKGVFACTNEADREYGAQYSPE